MRVSKSGNCFSDIYGPFRAEDDFRLLSASWIDGLGQVLTESDGEGHKKCAPTGFGKLDVDVVAAGSFSIIHLEGRVPYLVNQHSGSLLLGGA